MSPRETSPTAMATTSGYYNEPLDDVANGSISADESAREEEVDYDPSLSSESVDFIENSEETPGYVEPDSSPVIVEVPRHRSFGSNFPTIIYQLRSLQIIALIVQMCILYMESDRIGLAAALPCGVQFLNFYHTGKRLYQNIDGRFDLQQICAVSNVMLKIRYVYAVFGGLFYSILAFFVGGMIPSTVSAVLYSVSKFTTFGTSAIIIAAELYEVIMIKLGQRPNLLSKQL